MSASGIILRETAISVIINAVLSLVFFLVVFGMNEPIALGTLAPDFFPQSFMVVLMGTLVPSILLRRSVGGPARPIIQRSLTLALAAAVLGGGGGFALCQIEPSKVLPALPALTIKMAYGAVLAAIFTPIAIGVLLKERSISQ